ncbi:chaperonin 10-like protein [Phlebopus sp. FC_14]|nr:chaperonin 10-like protein [Phlebopus sp. FC_14]
MSSNTHRALFLTERQGPLKVGTKPTPKPGPGEILVKQSSAALNPADWKIQVFGFWITEFPGILGIDGAGEVEAVGEGVTEFKNGDKVFYQGSLSNDYPLYKQMFLDPTLKASGREIKSDDEVSFRGTTTTDFATFQEYVLVPADVACRLPSNITLDQAASLGVCVATASLPLYAPVPYGAGFKAPWDGGRGEYSGQPALIVGGASSVGQYAIQFARLSGFSPIIATASLHNAPLLRSLGATHVIDRNTPTSEIARELAKITSVPLSLLFDSISAEELRQVGFDLLGSGGHYVIVSPSPLRPPEGSDKKGVSVFATVLVDENRPFGRALAKHLPKLVEDGEFVPSQVEVVPGGLDGVMSGLERLKNNLVSGKKLVIHPLETETR